VADAPALSEILEKVRRAEEAARQRAGRAPEVEATEEIETLPAPAPRRKAGETRRKELTRMQVLERKRTFARHYFHSGLDAKAAMKAAAYKVPSTPSSMSTQLGKLLHDPVVAEEFAALMAAARQVEEVKVVETAKLFAEIAEADIFDYFEHSNGGLAIRQNVLELSKAQRRAVKKVKVTRNTRITKDGEEYVTVNTEIELWDRIQALVWLAKIQKLVEEGGDMETFARTLAERLNQYQKRTGRVFEADYHEVPSD
jgi:phage terminase small subunit